MRVGSGVILLMTMLATVPALSSDEQNTRRTAQEQRHAESETQRYVADNTEGGHDARPERPLLSLRNVELFIEWEASLDQRRVGSPRGVRNTAHRNRDLRFDQVVSLRLDGDIVDPAFLTWQGGLRVGVSYERFREKIGDFTRTESDSGLLLEHDVSMDLFPGRPISVHAYSRQLRDRVPRRFLPSLIEERREAGAAVFLRGDSWTTELALDFSDVDLSGNRQLADDERFETLLFHVDHRWEVSDRQRLRLAYNFQREQSTFQGSRFSFDTRRNQFLIEHDLQFGPQDQHRLDAFARLNFEQGDLARDEVEVAPRLTLRHSDTLRTIYRYTFYHFDQGTIDLDRHKADVQALWRPSDRFRLTGDLFWLREAIKDDLETHEFGGSLDASYRQPTSYGELLANASYTGVRSRSVGSVGERVVRGEAHALDPSRPTFLRETDINSATIVAFNADRTRVFVPGVDYRVQSLGRRTVVFRLLSGRIVEDELVFFDYRFRIPAGARLDTHRVDLLVEHAFESGLTPYYGFEIRRQSTTGSRARPDFEDNTERHRFGLRYDRPRWSAVGEIELFNDSIEPYDAYRLDTRVALVRQPARSVDASARASWFDFKGGFDSRRVWWVDVGVDGRLQHNPYLSSTFAAQYRWEEDSRDGTTNAVDLEYALRLRRGLLEVDLTVEYDLLSLDRKDEGLGVWLKVRRDLSSLLAQRGAVTR